MKMRCAYARSVVSDYINGDLDAQTATALEEHLRECDHCPPIYASLVAVRARVALLMRETPAWTPMYAERLRRALKPHTD